MNTTTRTLPVLAAAFCLMAATDLVAQNTFIPPAIQSHKSGFWNADVFAPSVPKFALGHQWGAARLDKANTALKMNVTGGNWGYLNPFAHEMHKLGEGDNDTNYIVWAEPLWWTPGRTGELFKLAWYGLRWEPAENSGLGRDWQPRDNDAWPFSFGAKYHGTIPTGIENVNYRRFMLDTASMASNPLRVLDSVEPRNYFRIYSGVDWLNPEEEKFIRDSLPRFGLPTDTVGWEYAYRNDWTVPSDSVPKTITADSTNIAGWYYLYDHDLSDGRRLQLVLNLRRTFSTDTILDDEPVLSVVVPYQMRWKDQDPTDSINFQPDRMRMPFRMVPMTDRDSAFDLPMSRGLEMKTMAVNVNSQYSDSVVITRRMLPLHSDPGARDITFVAEFRTDTIWGISVDLGDTTFRVRRPHVLKTAYFDFP